ncbi:MAG: hypothetical protein WDN06_03410 [Asticcacaulis sp.]
MENVHTDHDQRLRVHGERLLKALEAQPAPETYAEILRAARALIAVKKALDLLYKETAEVETRSRPAAKAPARTPAEAQAEEPTAEDGEDPPVLNRQMRRLAEALARKEARAAITAATPAARRWHPCDDMPSRPTSPLPFFVSLT